MFSDFGRRLIIKTRPGIWKITQTELRIELRNVVSSLQEMNHRVVVEAVSLKKFPTWLGWGVEPAGGIEHSICQIQFGCSNVKLHRHKKLKESAYGTFWRISISSCRLNSGFLLPLFQTKPATINRSPSIEEPVGDFLRHNLR